MARVRPIKKVEVASVAAAVLGCCNAPICKGRDLLCEFDDVEANLWSLYGGEIDMDDDDNNDHVVIDISKANVGSADAEVDGFFGGKGDVELPNLKKFHI